MWMNLASNLAALMAERRLSQYELAKVSGVPQPTIQRILSGETADPKVGTLINLADALGLSVTDLLDGVSASPVHGVPVIGWATVGVVCADSITAPATMATTFAPAPPMDFGARTFAFRVTDDSMAATAGQKTYPPGCLVYVDPGRRDPAHDKPILARLQSGEVVFAVYMAQAGRVWLRLLNASYPPIHEPFDVVGVAIWKGEEI